MLTKKDKNLAASEAVRMEARDKIRLIAMPILPGENIKAQWRKVSRKTGLNARRVRSLWYGQAQTVHAHELDIIRDLATAEKEIDEAVTSVTDLRAEIADLRSRIDRILQIVEDTQHGQA